METAFCWLAHVWFYQWFYHFNRKVNVVTMVTSAKWPYFYFRSKIWRHHRLFGLDGHEVRNASSCQISSKSVKPRPSYGNFNFFKMVAATILEFLKFQIFLRSGRSIGLNCVIMPNFIEIAQTVVEIWLFFDFQDGGRRNLGFVKFQIFNARGGQRFEMHHRDKFRQNRSNRSWDILIFRVFQDGGRPPSWICNACVGTTHEGHLVVFVTVQNLAWIDAVVLIMCTFFDFASLAWKRLFTKKETTRREVSKKVH